MLHKGSMIHGGPGYPPRGLHVQYNQKVFLMTFLNGLTIHFFKRN